MWPLVQSDDACTFHPIQAVTAKDGVHSIQKDASVIEVGDIVFCCVQRSQQYYAHIVLGVSKCFHTQEDQYWIGNIQGVYNGWCYREHIFGILVEVQQVWEDGQYYSRPHPKTNFAEVRALVKDDRWNSRAQMLCEPWWDIQPLPAPTPLSLRHPFVLTAPEQPLRQRIPGLTATVRRPGWECNSRATRRGCPRPVGPRAL